MFGFTVRIDLSWLIILALVVWSLAGGYFPNRYEGLGWGVYLGMGLAAAMGLFVSIVFHELCHSLVARRYGLPMKGITLFMFGGVAEMQEEPPSAKAEFLMALAGPAASAAVCGAFLGISYAGEAASWPETVVGVLWWIGFINGILVAFNLIPGFPLDGGRVLRAALWKWKGDLQWATRAASRVGAGFGAVLMGFGFVALLFGNAIGGLWYILIGLFIRGAAKTGYRQVLIRQALKGEPVRRFMNEEPVTVPASATVEDLVENYVYRHHFKMFPVVEEDKLIGCVTTDQVKEVPREQWNENWVGDLARNCSDDNTVGPDEDAMKALSRMNNRNVSRLMVVQDSSLEGILSLKDLLKFLSLKLELEDEEGGPPPKLQRLAESEPASKP